MEKLIRKINESIKKNANTEFLLINLANRTLKRPYIEGEKIDIVFIFQSASFWPSWESVWDACNADDSFNPIMLLCDESIKEKTQFRTARKFLEEKNIPFEHVNDANIETINPHIIVLHTPYDGHRPRYLYGKRLSALGYRIVYIPYGIEISDIQKAREDHFTCGVTTASWRIYTFSKDIIPYYKMFSPTGGEMVRSFGHPKFDYLNKKKFPSLPTEIIKKAKGRKVLLLKVHFPKKVNGKMITPPIGLYEFFLNSLTMYKNLFCIFMPHPKFYEELAKFRDVKKIKGMIDNAENIIEYTGDDYRQVLVNCDYYIVDRSALMIEAGITNKPILYIKTALPEAMTAPVQKIVDSYYQAVTRKDIKKFIDDVVIPDNDPLKDRRRSIFESVIPPMSGKSGYNIKEDIKDSLSTESLKENNQQNTLLTSELKEYITELYQMKESQDAIITIHKQKVMNHLTYRVGKVMMECTRTPFGFFKIPFRIRKAHKEFNQEQKMTKLQKRI
jgi:hypothetical protein